MRAAAVLAALLAALPACAAVEAVECPAGTHRQSTDDPFVPFKCVAAGEEAKKGFDAVVGPRGFAARPHCPRGTRPVASPERSLQPYHCVRITSGDADPELTPLRGDGAEAAPPPAAAPEDDALTRGCPRGQRKVRTTDPLLPYQCVAAPGRAVAAGTGAYTRYAVAHELAFEHLREFRVQDAWKEDVPTLYLKIDDSSAGKPVTITINRYEARQPTFQDLDSAVARDVEWQSAKDAGTVKVAGRNARVTAVAGDTRSVYLPTSKQSYYAFVYSAPADVFDRYLPSFERLLKTLTLDRAER